MNGFWSLPYAPIIVLNSIATVLWIVLWGWLYGSSRLERAGALLGGWPLLIGGLILTGIFGGPVLLFSGLSLMGLTVWWMFAAMTGTFEEQRLVIRAFLASPKKKNKREEDQENGKDDSADTE
jgi:hypothetical protein